MMNYKSIAIMLWLGLLLVACVRPNNNSAKHSTTSTAPTSTVNVANDRTTQTTQQPEEQPTAVIQQVSVQNLAAATGDYLLLDVREPWEYRQGHIAGAQLIPLGQLAARVQEISEQQNIYVICRSGNRSMVASRILQASSPSAIRHIYNVQGGLIAWQQAGFATERLSE